MAVYVLVIELLSRGQELQFQTEDDNHYDQRFNSFSPLTLLVIEQERHKSSNEYNYAMYYNIGV